MQSKARVHGGTSGREAVSQDPCGTCYHAHTGVQCFAVSGTQGPMQGIAGNEAEEKGGGECMHI